MSPMTVSAPETPPGKATNRYRPSLSATLTLGFSVLFLIALGAILWISLGAAQKSTFELLRAQSELSVEIVVDEVDDHLGAAQVQAAFLAGLIVHGNVDPDDEPRLADVMLGTLAAVPQVSGIAYVRPDFSVTRVGRGDDGFIVLRGDWSDNQGIVQSMQQISKLRSRQWRGIAWSEDFRAPHIVVSEPVFRDDEFLGMVFAIVSISALSGFLDEADRVNGTHSFILYGRDRVIAHPSLVGGFRGLSADKPLPSLGDVNDVVLTSIWDEPIDDMKELLADSYVDGHVVEGRDDEYIYLFRVIDSYGQAPWTIGVYFRGREVDTPLRRLFLAAAIGLGILAVAVIASVVLARIVARSITRVERAATATQRLDLENVEPLKSSPFRELDSVAKAWDSMIGGLRWFETYVPKTLVFRLMELGGQAVRSEERQVSVLFTDIVGFTRLSARHSPGELAEVLNDHFTALGAAIEAEDGTVDKYIGDSVMAFWGAPLDQPDHAVRACRTALAIAERIAADNQGRAPGEELLGLRIGIHSGPAIVGNIGAPGRVNYTLIGDTVNVAQRLEAMGKEVDGAPGPDDGTVMILLSGDTVRQLDGAFALEDLGCRELRGRGEPIDVYRLVPPGRPTH